MKQQERIILEAPHTKIVLPARNAKVGSRLEAVVETEPGVFALAIYEAESIDGDRTTYRFVGYPALDKETGEFVLVWLDNQT